MFVTPGNQFSELEIQNNHRVGCYYCATHKLSNRLMNSVFGSLLFVKNGLLSVQASLKTTLFNGKFFMPFASFNGNTTVFAIAVG